MSKWFVLTLTVIGSLNSCLSAPRYRQNGQSIYPIQYDSSEENTAPAGHSRRGAILASSFIAEPSPSERGASSVAEMFIPKSSQMTDPGAGMEWGIEVLVNEFNEMNARNEAEIKKRAEFFRKLLKLRNWIKGRKIK